MTSRIRASILLWAALAAGGQALADDDIHLPIGKTTGYQWVIQDGAGFRWDISSGGQVDNGANNAFNGGMFLYVNNSNFSWGAAARLSADGREIELGPWTTGAVQVFRRIYVDAKTGYCRWIDIFLNTSGGDTTLSLRYQINSSAIQNPQSTSGKPVPAEKDWGLVTGWSDGSGRPSLAHVYAAKGAKVKPQVQCTPGSQSMTYTLNLPVPAGKAVALVFFEAQRAGFADAQKFLKDFNAQREMALVPAGLRKIIVNAGTAGLTLENIDLPRNDKNDLAVLRSGDEWLGTILNEQFPIETFYGRLDLPGRRVMGLVVPAADDTDVQVVLTDGQVVAGKFLGAPLRMKLANGSEMALPPSNLKTASFKPSPERPEEIVSNQAAAILRSGQRLFFNPADLDYTFHTESGDLKLLPQDVKTIHLDTPDNGLHRAVFTNGSVLSGLLAAEDVVLRLELGPTLKGRRSLFKRFDFPSADEDHNALATLTLRNEDQLFGHLAEPSLTVQTRFGDVTVDSSEIAAVQIPEEASLGQVQIKQHNGTLVSGLLKEQTIRFKMDPGPEVPVFIGRVVEITCPKPEPKPATNPGNPPMLPPGVAVDPPLPRGSTAPAPTTSAPKVGPAGAAPEAAAAVALLQERLAKTEETIGKVQSQIDELKANGGGTPAEKEAKLAKLLAELNALKAKRDQLQKQIAVQLDEIKRLKEKGG